MQPWSFTVAEHFAGEHRSPAQASFLRPDYRDGKRFLVNRNVRPEHIAPLTLEMKSGHGFASSSRITGRELSIVRRISTDKRPCIDWPGQLPGGRQLGS